MVRVSNKIITSLNILTLILACSAIGFSLWFHIRSETPCQRTLKTPLLTIGVSLILISLAGLVGSCCRVSALLWIYLMVLFLLILGLVGFTIFALVVTNRGAGKALSGKGVGEHRLGDYSKWLQRYVVNAENWDEIKSCLLGVKLCQSIEGGKSEEFYKHKLSPIKSGCCKPPINCGFRFKNATFWTAPEKGPALPDNPDCKSWSNDQNQLCLDCESCKTAVLHNIKRQWRMLALINIGITLFVIAVYSIGCCALRNNRDEKKSAGPA